MADERERTEKTRTDALVATRKDQLSVFQAVQKDREAAANARESAREQHEQGQVEKFLQYKNDQYDHEVRSEQARFDASQAQRNDRFREQSLQAYAAGKEDEQKTARQRAQTYEVAVAKSVDAYAERLKHTAEITGIHAEAGRTHVEIFKEVERQRESSRQSRDQSQAKLDRKKQQREDARRDYSAKIEAESKLLEQRHKIYSDQQKQIKSLLDHENELLRQQNQSIRTAEDQCARDEQEKTRAEWECTLIEAKLKKARAERDNIAAQLTNTKFDDPQAYGLREMFAKIHQEISELEVVKLAAERTVISKEQARENWMSRLDDMREERARVFERINALLDRSQAIDQREESFFDAMSKPSGPSDRMWDAGPRKRKQMGLRVKGSQLIQKIPDHTPGGTPKEAATQG
jgi:hypothetical protein